MSFWHAAFRPLQQFADFRGRSTRTELIAFTILTGSLGLALSLAGDLAGYHGRDAYTLISLALLCPYLALYVRRLHDSGRSGWWLLLGLPPAAINLWREYLLWQSPRDLSHLYLPAYIELPAGLLALAILALLLWDDEEESNLYGPNPRYSDDAARPEPSGGPA